MSGHPIKGTLLRACAAAAVGVTLAGAAHAQTTIFGGGATLPQPTYSAEFTAFTNTVDPTIAFSYVGDGSGAGIAAFLNNTPATHGYPVGTSIAFGAADAFLSAAQIASWATLATGQAAAGNLIQVPMFGTAITVGYNLATQRGNGSIRLTDDQICGIFSGRTTNYSQLTGINATGRPPTGPITVGYRLDGSGTSFLFTQHLAAVCTRGVNSNVTFTASTSFASIFGVNGNPPLPGNFVGGTGNGGVRTNLLATVGQMAYLSPDFTQIAPVNTGNASFPVVASVRNATDGIFYTPTVVATRTALSTAAAPSTPAQLANPAAYVPSIPNPGAGYPIVGFTNWDLAQCYANPNVAIGLAEFLFNHYSIPQFTNIITQNGFSLLPNTFVTAINDNIISNNTGNNLDIGNTTACAGLPGR